MTDSDSSSYNSNLESAHENSLLGKAQGFHNSFITITEKARSFAKNLKHYGTKMPNQTEAEQKLNESLAREEKLKDELSELREYIKTFGIESQPAAPTEDEIVEEISKVSFDRHREIRELLIEIRDFDGTTDVEAFLAQCRRVNKQMKTDAEKIILINKIIAQKLRGEAIAVADRLIEISPKEFADAMRLAFGKTEKDYSQLTEERNSMRQGYVERIENFIKRYSEIDKSIQKSIDQVDPEFKIVYRKIENKERISRFLRALKPEIKALVMTQNPITLNDAYQYAMREEKIFKDDEMLRNKQRGGKFENFGKKSIHENKSIEGRSNSNRDKCNFCERIGHKEENCFKKNPQLKNSNFQKTVQQSKDPPKRIHETQESYIAPPELEYSEESAALNEKIQFCSPASLEPQLRMDYW